MPQGRCRTLGPQLLGVSGLKDAKSVSVLRDSLEPQTATPLAGTASALPGIAEVQKSIPEGISIEWLFSRASIRTQKQSHGNKGRTRAFHHRKDMTTLTGQLCTCYVKVFISDASLLFSFRTRSRNCTSHDHMISASKETMAEWQSNCIPSPRKVETLRWMFDKVRAVVANGRIQNDCRIQNNWKAQIEVRIARNAVSVKIAFVCSCQSLSISDVSTLSEKGWVHWSSLPQSSYLEPFGSISAGHVKERCHEAWWSVMKCPMKFIGV